MVQGNWLCPLILSLVVYRLSDLHIIVKVKKADLTYYGCGHMPLKSQLVRSELDPLSELSDLAGLRDLHSLHVNNIITQMAGLFLHVSGFPCDISTSASYLLLLPGDLYFLDILST
ncbi:hypothetical protein MA16_Dca007633 [Dendrobium catenatum]|uniref:Uncharacterized protein n=1 Tax=Dendrobium catenatum TaxID=906689 RepID=A0A2I0X0U1_9ASPA|nr:hypothetical protein MA16_Dca007633 [Dendrobium catenatum]